MKLKNGNDTLCIFYDMNFSENFKELQIDPTYALQITGL